MKIVIRIGRGAKDHAAEYDETTGRIELYCDSLKYPEYFAAVTDPTPPTADNVTCKKCLKNINEWAVK